MKAVKTAVKAAVAAAMLAAVAAAFFGAPTQAACKIQPAPTFVFLAVLLLTPLLGRLFCECFCPLGIVQTAVNALFRRRRRVRRVCTRLPSGRIQTAFRLAVLAAFAALVASGFGAVAWSISPYSIFGKCMVLFWPGVALFVVVVLLAACGRGRTWCNWICPAGTLFWLLSRKSLLAHKVGPGCANCRACFPEAAKKGNAPAAAQTQGGVSRRETLKSVAALAAVDAAEKTTDGGFADISLHESPERGVPVLPPGALDRAMFDAKCVGCGLCVSACRGGCLAQSRSLRHFGQPEMDFRNGWCLTGCSGECGRVCPAGAIRQTGRGGRVKVATGCAVWKKSLCIRETEGVQCTACVRKCPVKAISIVEGYPVVDRNACIGCGACEYVCPARPAPAIHVEGFERQRIVAPAAGGEDALAEMIRMVEKGEASCAAARNGVICGKASGRGVAPLLELRREGALKGAVVVDKVVGRAAAAICIASGAVRVHARIMADDAAKMLKEAGVAAEAAKSVPKILAKDLATSCPMERLVEGLSSPGEMVKALEGKVRLP